MLKSVCIFDRYLFIYLYLLCLILKSPLFFFGGNDYNDLVNELCSGENELEMERNKEYN